MIMPGWGEHKEFKMINKLIKLATYLDSKKLYREASYVDRLMFKKSALCIQGNLERHFDEFCERVVPF